MSRSALPRRTGALVLALGALAGCRDTTGPRIPAAIEIIAGDVQSAVVGTVVPQVPTVRVVTKDGKPVQNAPVTFAATTGGGTIADASTTTDRNGLARAIGWKLGTTAGENQLTAVTGLLGPATFHATGTADVPAGMVIVREPAAASTSGAPLPTQPVIQLVDQFGNHSQQAGVSITAAVVEGAASIANGTAVTAADGTATFTALALDAPAGPYTLEFRGPGLAPRRAAGPIVVGGGICGDAGAGAITLALQPGQLLRTTADALNSPTCLAFEFSRAAGQQYLLLFENMPVNGRYDQGIFDEQPQSAAEFSFTVRGTPSVVANAEVAAAFRQLHFAVAAEAAAAYQWDFGDGPIREGSVGPLPAGVSQPKLLRNGVALSLADAAADPQVGDTVSVYLEGIPRLSIPSGQQKAVIRALSNQLIFAEDIRLGTLPRDGSTAEAPAYNTPLSQVVMDSIALEYANFARVQGDLLFQSRYNNAIESRSPTNRVLAVHTLMYANNIWGYTYSSSHYFAFDYWVGATNGVNRGFSQHPQRVADDLFMHEIAHLRHYGMLERAGRTAQRGNQWLVEGFARFTERLPIANRLLGQVSPSRTGNVVLPRNPAFGGNTYFFDDVPTYLQAGASMFGGYGASSFVFDYFADQVALGGGDVLVALRDFLLNAGASANLDATVARWLPGVGSFAELFTRARVALYTDDLGGTPLPAWTQYQQFQLRASRPPGSQSVSDPRNAWITVSPGQPFSTDLVVLPAGAARGLLIDGTSATSSARITIEAPRAANGVISIVRIR